MGQKYTFFIKANSVTFSEDKASGNAVDTAETHPDDRDILATWTKQIEAMSLDRDREVQVGDLQDFMSRLFAAFRVIKAAGGYVLNPGRQLLMIYRRGYWDLPKGKLDEGETSEEAAVREVEEECGIGGLRITSEPFETYHVYEEKGNTVIKQSIWYKMQTDSVLEPVPQGEEDITDAQWVTLPVPSQLLDGAYGSIRAVIAHFSTP